MKPIKTYYLDISGCPEKIRKEFHPITKIPLITGAFFCDLDVIEEELPAEICNRLRYDSEGAKTKMGMIHSLYGDEGLNDADYMPFGVDFDSVDICGGKLIEREGE